MERYVTCMFVFTKYVHKAARPQSISFESYVVGICVHTYLELVYNLELVF